MPVYFDTFDQAKVDTLRSHLLTMAEEQTPKYYEIFVDTLKAIQKTNDPKLFDNYENYLTPFTNSIKILIYCSGASPRNEQYFFSLKAQSIEEALELGLNGISSKTYSMADLKKMKIIKSLKTLEGEEIKKLKLELNGLKADLKDKEEYINVCEIGLSKAKANGNKIGGIHGGEMILYAIEKFAKKNAKKIEAFTGLDGLAGYLEAGSGDEVTLLLDEPPTEATFKKKDTTTSPVLNDQEREFLDLFKVLQSHFNTQEMLQVVDILESLSKNKTQLQPIVDLLKD